jgi:hypothetical protein
MPLTLTHSTPPVRYPKLAGFATATLLTGATRFALTVAGVPDEITRYASMTAVILIAILYYGRLNPGRRERVIVAYLLVAPYMFIEVVGLGYTWWSGARTIFHTPPYTLGTSIAVHFLGHLAGGLSWEPAIVCGLIWAVSRLWRFRPQ